MIVHFFIVYFLFGALFEKAFAVHGQHNMRKAAQQRRMDTDTELEEELDADAEEEVLLDRIMSLDPAAILHKEQQTTAAHHPIQGIQFQQNGHQQAFGFEQGETRDFLQFLRRIHYDHRQCPQNGEGQPVLISVSVVVSNVRAVSEVTMDYSLEMFYRESWLDSRLRYDVEQFRNKTELALHESYANFLWHPDTFMPNAIASKNPRKQSISHRSLLRLQSDGQILYSRRLSVVAECPMDLTLFPFDSQTCKLGIESYGYTSDQVRYGWSHGQRAALKLHKIRLPDFRIKEAFVTSQMESYATGNYSRLYVCFVFSRSAGFCFLQLIIPSTAVVITSWVSLWMENETSFQDMISIILTITFLLFSYNEVMPRVSYLKALDIWLAVCFMIVFLSLIKLAIMKYMRQRLKLETANAANEHSLLAGMLPFVQLGTAPARQIGNGLLPAGNLYRRNSTNQRAPTPPPHLRPMANATLEQRVNRRSCRQQASAGQQRRTPSAGSSAEEEGKRRRSTVSSGLEAMLGGAISQLLAQQAATALATTKTTTTSRRKGSAGSVPGGSGIGSISGGPIAPYQPPISTLAATALNLPLSQSSLRQLQQQQLYQMQQQLQLQAQLQQNQLLHQAQMQALREEKRRERRQRKERERLQQQQRASGGGRRRQYANQNEMGTRNAPRRSPIHSIRIGIESSSSSDDESLGQVGVGTREKRIFFCFDQFGNVEFSAQFMRRFHWLSQMSFFFGFVLFCLYFFLVYPNSRSTAMDPACKREEAEWFASIPT